MKNIVTIIFIVCSFAITGCENRKVSREVRRLTGSRIDFPLSLKRIAGRETQPFVIDKQKAHILVYYDSTACGTCVVNKLSNWDDLIADTDPSVDFIFLMSPKAEERNSVLRSTIINNADYNVALDWNGDFAKSNPQIPQDERFHTLLLDRDGKVLLVGSPLHNEAIRKLYEDAITDMSIQ